MSKKRRHRPQVSQHLSEELTGQQVIGALPAGSWLLSQPLNRRMDYRKIEDMRRHETISYIMTLLTVAGESSEWTVEADEGVPWEAINLIKMMIMQIKTDLWESTIDGWVCYGWAPYEIVYGTMTTDTGYTRYNVRRLKSLLQENTLVNMDSEYGFTGLQVMFPKPVTLPLVKSLILTNEKRGDNLFGRSIFCKVEHVYDLITQTTRNLQAFDAKRHGPRYVVHYPYGTTNIKGVKKNNVEIADEMVHRLEGYNVIALGHRPNTIASQMQRAQSDWGIEVLPMENVSGEFISQFMYFDKLLCRGFGIHERAVLESIFGTKADAANGTDYAVMRIEYLVNRMIQQVNQFVVDRLLGMNYFGLKGRVRIVAGTIDKRVTAAAVDLVRSLLQTPWGQSVMTEMLDIDNILDQSGIPRVQESETLQPLVWTPETQQAPIRDINAPPPGAYDVLAHGGIFHHDPADAGGVSTI